RALLERYRDTNYAVVDRPLIEQIYEMLYLQRIDGTPRHALLANRAIEAATRTADGRIELATRDRMSGATQVERFDALVLAT
ncbi:ornithine monooxygenase, partial [Burkholderia multivorans]